MKTKYIWAGLLFIFNMSAFAQFGALDLSLDPGIGPDDVIQVTAVQADAKIIIAGDFTTFNGIADKRVARLHPDGTIDGTFNIGSGANKLVTSIAIQPDGKVIAVGEFTIFNNTSRKRIVRLNENGSVDTSFTIGFGANETINNCLLQDDGKIMIGGIFTAYNWVGRNGIARINPNGTLDTTFEYTGGPLEVSDIKRQADGKYIVNTLYRVLRLNADGSIDPSFNSGLGSDYPIKSVLVQTNGKILLGGYFTTYDGFDINRITRLMPDGSIDVSFNYGVAANYGVLSISEQPDGQLLISGMFSSYDNTLREKIARLSPDGLIDETFNPDLGPNSIVLSHTLQADGKILIVGDFTEYDGVPRNKIARITGFEVELSVNEANAMEMKIYPNPASDMLNIQMPEGQFLTSAQVYDMTGKLLSDTKGSINAIDVSNLSKGVYLLTVNTEDTKYNSRFIKQ